MSISKKILILVGDVILLYVSLFLTVALRYGFTSPAQRFVGHAAPFSFIFVLWIIVFYLFNLYHPKTLRNKSTILNSLLAAVPVAGVVSIIAFYLFAGLFKLTPKTNLLILSLIFFALDFLWRAYVAKLFAAGALSVVVVGNSPLLAEAVEFVSKNPQTGYCLARWFKEIVPETIPKIETLVEDKKNQIAVILQPHISPEIASTLIKKLMPLQVNFLSFWDFYELIFEKAPLEELEESWFVENIVARRPIYDTLKRALDLFLGIFLAIVFLPIAVLIAILIKLTSPGPVIYKSQRVGRGNIPITVYKFRTMKVIDEGPFWTEKNDPRITPLGKFLRFTHLDETPQFWNIIRGDLSFTGPRPENIKLAEQFKQFPYYEIRHIVKPGLTGWAQINYRPSASFEEAKEKLRYDLFYIKNRSFSLDLRIILRTIKYLFSSHG
jgi:exopolysaccharide biosynthesis polyprenyl glycosylphosphotransferase